MKYRVMNASDSVKTVKVIRKDGRPDTITIQPRGRPIIEDMKVADDHQHDPNLIVQDLEKAAAPAPKPAPAPEEKDESEDEDEKE